MSSLAQQKSSVFPKFASLMTGSMLVSALGTYLGIGINSLPAFIVLMVLFFLGAFGVRLAAKVNHVVGIGALGAWVFISGLFIGPAIGFYVHALGVQIVLYAYLATAGVMAVCGVIGALSGVNFSSLGRWLIIPLLLLVLVGLVGIFVQFGTTMNLLYGGFGMLIFAGYFLYDFWVMQNVAGDNWEDAIEVTMNVYLNYINFLLSLLRVLYAIFGKKS